MTIMQGQDNISWYLLGLLFTILTVIGVWYLVIVGRDRPPSKQRRGESTIVRYGDIEEDRAPLAKFLIWGYIGFGVWAVGYLLWTGIYGLGW